jgi:hypothetical protein
MSDYSVPYQVACVPGQKAAAAMTPGPAGKPVLVIYLDPVNMTIHSEPSRAGARQLGAFFRELSREAAKFAAQIDPEHEIPDGPRRQVRERPAEWFTGSEPQ